MSRIASRRSRLSAARRLSTPIRIDDVEHRGRLVGHEQIGIDGERAGDGDTLPLPTRELVGMPVDELLRRLEPDGVQQLDRLGAGRARRGPMVPQERPHQVVRDRVHRVQGSERVLEDHLDPTPVVERGPTRLSREHVLAVEPDLTAVRGLEPQHQPGDRALPAPRLADERHRLAAVDAEGDVLGGHDAPGGAQEPPRREGLAQPADLEKGSVRASSFGLHQVPHRLERDFVRSPNIVYHSREPVKRPSDPGSEPAGRGRNPAGPGGARSHEGACRQRFAGARRRVHHRGRRGVLPDRRLRSPAPLPDEHRQRHRPVDVRHLRRRADRRPRGSRRQPVPLRDRRQAARRASPHRTGHPGPRPAQAAAPDVLWEPFSERSDRRVPHRAQSLQERHRQPAGLRGDQPRSRARLPLPLVRVRRVRLGAHGDAGEPRRPRGRGRAARRPAQRPALRRAARPLPAVEQPRRRLQADRAAIPRPGSAIFSLTARIIDRAEAAEELRANTVWCHGLESFDVRLSRDAVGRVPARRAAAARRRPHRAPRQLPGRRAARAGAGRDARSGTGRRRRPDHVQIAALRAPAARAPRTSTGRSRANLESASDEPAAQRRQRRRPAAHGPPGSCRSTTSPTCSSTTCAAASSPGTTTIAGRGLRRLPPNAQPRGGRPPGGSPRRPARPRSRWPSCSRTAARHGRRRLRAAALRVPAALLRPAARRSEPSLEPFLDPRPQPGRRPGAALRGQLAGHLPELGGARL